MKRTKTRAKKVKHSKKRRTSAARKSVSRKARAPKPIGKVKHFFNGISVATIKFSKEVSLGKMIRFVGATTNFSQKISEMQYDHKPIAKAKKGKTVGVKVKDRVREGDSVLEEV